LGAVVATNLSEGLLNTARFEEALTTIDHALDDEEARGRTFYTPETLRMKGHILSTMPDGDLNEAEKWLGLALELSRQQAAFGWELRTGISLAQLQSKRGRSVAARELLESICSRAKTSSERSDLAKARRILADLTRSSPSRSIKKRDS
jgi:tetratricopeptide (TPR) repeat protein